MKILILCTGNSCRSQMAEGFLKSFDPSIEVYSAGTRPEKKINPRTVEVMREKGIDLSGHSPTHVNEYLEDHFDYLITVCDGAKESCPAFSGQVLNRLHFGFEDPAAFSGTESETLAVYKMIRGEIEEAFYKFYKQIRKDLN